LKKIYGFFDHFPAIECEHYILRKVIDSDFKDLFDIYSDVETVQYEGIEPIRTDEESKEYTQSIIKGYKNFRSQIGYILNRRYCRNNIMYQVVSEIISFIFLNTEIHRLETSIHPENLPSIHLSRKLGFKLEGIKRHGAYNNSNS